VTPRHRALGVIALVMGLGAAVFGSRPASGSIDVAKLARAVANEDDHVTAIELAQWIRARRPGLRVIDLRSATDFDSLHIPTAEQAAIDTLDRIRFKSGETIVLYSEGGAHSAQAWVFLKALGHTNVFFLRGGVYEWLGDVLSPGLPADATDSEREAFAKASELSRYFGGQPRTGVSREERAVTVSQIRRRGC
jgi:rhodanese-related sulfurtransferase